MAVELVAQSGPLLPLAPCYLLSAFCFAHLPAIFFFFFFFCLTRILIVSLNVFNFIGEAASQREAINSLSQKLAKAEAHANSMENEVHRVTLQLTEKGLLLEVLQREKDQAGGRVKELEMTLHAERELVSRAGARQEATQERLAQAQSEGMLLRQQLEEAQNKGVAKERAVTDAQERFSDILSKLRSDCEERVQLVEERNKELATKAADLRDQIFKLEDDKNEREVRIRPWGVRELHHLFIKTNF